MLDRALQVAARQMLERQVQVMMRHLDRDAHRFQIAEVHRARDQHLVADHRHLAAELAFALRTRIPR